MVTDADIARAAKSQPVITEADEARAARRHRMPSAEELARVPLPSVNIDALPQPATRAPIDIGAIAQGFEAAAPSPLAALQSAGRPALLVFVSFSMPEASLRRLVDQASKAGATLVLRGFVDGSLQTTVARIQGLIGERKVGFQIDPQAFDRFSIAATPTFVLVKAGAVPAPCATGTCVPTAQFVSVVGDVSVDYALRFVAESAAAFAPDARTVLARMKGRT